MRRTSLILAIAIAIALASVRRVEAGAWGQDKGHFFLSMQTYFYTTDQYFDCHGNSHDRGGRFNKYELNPYLEYGLSSRDTLIANIFFDILTDDASGSQKTTVGLADMEIGLQHRLYKGDVGVAAIQGLLVIPTGYDIDDDPRLGYGRFGAEASFLYGRWFKLFKHYGFMDLRMGLRQYFGYPATQLHPVITAGYDLSQRWQLMASAEMHYGLDNGSEKKIGPNVLIQPNYRLLKLTLSARYRLGSHYSLVASAYSHAWGEDTGRGGGGYVSIWFSF